MNGLELRYLVRRLADGSIDPAFAPNPDSAIHSVAVGDGDAIFVAGSFTSIGGVARAGIAKLSATGVVDSAFDPGVGPGGISSMRIGAPGELFAAGNFTTIGGVGRNKIAKLSSSTGAVDAAWAPQITGAFGVTINDLAYDAGTSSLFVGGDFQRIDGVVRLYLLKLDANGAGAGDPAWDPTPNLPVNALQLDGAGGLYVGGAFDAIGGMQQGRLARLSTTTGAIAPWFPSLPIGQSVRDIALLGTGLHVAGLVMQVNGEPRGNIARLSTVDASLDLAFDADFPAVINRVFVAPDGAVIAGSGQQTHTDGQVRTGAAVLDADGSLGPKMDLLAPGTIHAMSVLPSGETVLAGDFYYIDASEHANLAKLSVEGDIVPTWIPSTDGDVRSISTDALGNVYVAGGFALAGGMPKPYLAKFSTAAAGSVDAAWTPLPDGPVRSVSVAANGAVFVGGSFTQIGGAARARIARLQPGDGAAVAGWGSETPGSTIGQVNLVSATPAGDVIASGTFTQLNG
ncbi:MAG TPA: hypothetical protein VFO79_12470, partial [Xanthomonadales bacterium]|nr:hypothetical protein [Xanthomonadales bacterium]